MEQSSQEKIELRLVSRRFVVESAIVWVMFRIESAGRRKKLTTPDGWDIEVGGSVSDDALAAIAGHLQQVSLTRGSATVLVHGPCIVERVLWGIELHWPAAETALYTFCEFRQEITAEEWDSGVATVSMDLYREVTIRIRDIEGRPSAGRLLCLPLSERSFDLPVDQQGEVKLLLRPGQYLVGAGAGVHIRFEVVNADGPQIFEMTR